MNAHTQDDEHFTELNTISNWNVQNEDNHVK